MLQMKQINVKVYLLIFTGLLSSSSLACALEWIYPAANILHQPAPAIVNIYGKPSRKIKMKDGLSYICEWHLGGRNLIVIEFDPFGICTSYGFSGLISKTINENLLGPIAINAKSYSFQKENSWNPFASKKRYKNPLGYKAIVSSGYIEVSIDRSLNQIYLAQVQRFRR